jgi:acetyltransferase-like isoleucine patch superfamily enzyme
MPIVYNAGTITIGSEFYTSGWRTAPEIRVGPGGTLRIGDHSSMNAGTLIEVASRITIGDNVAIAAYAVISDTGNHEVEQGAAIRIEPVDIGSKCGSDDTRKCCRA